MSATSQPKFTFLVLTGALCVFSNCARVHQSEPLVYFPTNPSLSWRLGGIRGKVETKNGNFQYLQETNALCYSGSSRVYTGKIQPDGSFRFGMLAPGLYRVVLLCRWYRQIGQINVQVRRNTWATLNNPVKFEESGRDSLDITEMQYHYDGPDVQIR